MHSFDNISPRFRNSIIRSLVDKFPAFIYLKFIFRWTWIRVKSVGSESLVLPSESVTDFFSGVKLIIKIVPLKKLYKESYFANDILFEWGGEKKSVNDPIVHFIIKNVSSSKSHKKIRDYVTKGLRDFSFILSSLLVHKLIWIQFL